jgi:hypothetical protein
MERQEAAARSAAIGVAAMTRVKPTGLKRAYLRQCLDVLCADPPQARWRQRPREHFADALGWANWNKTFAGQSIRAQADGRLRLSLTLAGERRHYDLRAIIAEIGVTPVPERFGAAEGIGPDGPIDRLGAVRAIAGTGRLARFMRRGQAETGASLDELSVMDADHDPYRADTPSRRAAAQWFAERVREFVAPGRRIHVRGVFYACVSSATLDFANNATNEKWLSDAARYARWLGYVDFERLVDNKNDEPVVRPAPPPAAPRSRVVSYDLEIEDLDADDLGVGTDLEGFAARQPYRLAIFGEKTSLEDVLGPLAEEYGTDLYLSGGQISDTHLHRIAKDAADDGRPLVLFTFSDCDPAGYWDMPTSIGRKLRALRDLKFQSLRFTAVHAGLSPDQTRELRLPSSPLKEGEKRGEDWLALYGLEQTEIDALATLRPDTLEQLAREVFAPYYDATLKARVEAAREVWQARADAELAAQLDEEQLANLQARARDALAELEEVNGETAAMRDAIDVTEPTPPLPEPDMDALGDAQDAAEDRVLITDAMDYLEATERLRAHNEMDFRRQAAKERKRRTR